jgi:WD40 repeat protein
MIPTVDLDFTSVGCNKISQCSDTCGSLLAYGASSFLALTQLVDHQTDPDSSDALAFGNVTTLKGHTARVTAVHWIQDGWVMSGSADKSVRLWGRKEDGSVRDLVMRLQKS